MSREIDIEHARVRRRCHLIQKQADRKKTQQWIAAGQNPILLKGYPTERLFWIMALVTGIDARPWAEAFDAFWNMAGFPPDWHKSPDFLCSRGGALFFVDVKGCTEGRVVKIRTDAMIDYQKWNEKERLYFFFYDHSTGRYALTRFSEIPPEGWPQEPIKDEWLPDGSPKLLSCIPKQLFQWRPLTCFETPV